MEIPKQRGGHDRPPRSRPRHLVASALVAVLAVGCSEATEPVGSPGSDAENSPVTAPITSSPRLTPEMETTPEPKSLVIQADVRDGKVAGFGDVVDVPLGEVVRLEVSADVRDEVHVHGYGEIAEVGPGKTAILRFVAEIPGVFEVELEESGLALGELRVR